VVAKSPFVENGRLPASRRASTGWSSWNSWWRSGSRRVRSRAVCRAGDCTGCTEASTPPAIPTSPSVAVWLAATFAGGEGVVLSHRSAAHLRQLIDRSGAVEMTSSRKLSPRRDVVCRMFGSLAQTDREVLDAIPCASVPLTLLGLAATAPATLPGALARAERCGRLDLSAIAELIARRPRTPGGPALRRALRAYRVEWEWTKGRARAPGAGALPCRRDVAAGRQRLDRSFGGRLRGRFQLALAAIGRRGRRVGDTRRPARIRGGPRPRRRLARAEVHLAPGRTRAGGRAGSAPSPRSSLKDHVAEEAPMKLPTMPSSTVAKNPSGPGPAPAAAPGSRRWRLARAGRG
jgi:hypothetical protein